MGRMAVGRRTLETRIRRSTFAPVLLAVLAAFLAGCSGSGKNKEPAVSVEAKPAVQTTIRKIVTAEAVLYPLQEAAITPKINAPVRKFYVNRGSKVHRGQLLAVLENQDLAAAQTENKGTYEQAQANYESATQAGVPAEMQKAELDVQQAKEALDAQQKVYTSRENLYKQGALPRKNLDQAAVALVQARSQYQIAEKHLQAMRSGGKQRALQAASGELTAAKGKYLASAAEVSYSEIRSPIDGVVTDRPFYPGEMASSSTPLLTVMDLSQIIAKAHIPQQEAALLKVGDPTEITAPGGAPVTAKVTLISPAVDPNSTTIEVWVQAANPSDHLRPGSTVQVSMTAEQVPNATVIPASALLTSPDGATSVMLVGADGRAHWKPVRVGILQDDQLQVVAGLTPGQLVITSGAYGLPDNTKVKLEETTGSSPSPAPTSTRRQQKDQD